MTGIHRVRRRARRARTLLSACVTLIKGAGGFHGTGEGVSVLTMLRRAREELRFIARAHGPDAPPATPYRRH